SWDLRQHEDGGGYDLRRPRPRLQSRSPVPSNRWRSQAHSGRCAGTIWSSRRPLGLNQWRVNEWPCTPASGWDRACVAPSVRARWRRDRSRTRSALSGGGSSCLDRSPRAMPNSMPGARTAVLHGPGRIRTRSFAIARSGGCFRTSVRAWCPMPAPSTASMPCPPRYRRPAWSDSTRTATRWTVALSVYRSRSAPMPNGSSSGRTAGSSANPSAPSAATGHLRSAARYSGAGPQARRPPERRSLQGMETAASDQARSAQAGQGAKRRPANGPDPLSMIPTDGLDAVESACARP
ncbi:hypothetical protein ATH84_10921, partial [Paracoccus versutus]